MGWWADYSTNNLEPKRKFTFILSIGGVSQAGDPLKLEDYLVKKVKKPGFEVTESTHSFLNHTFYYPGKVKWKEVSLSVVDVISPDTTNRFLKILQESGYLLPKAPISTVSGVGGSAQTLSKFKSVQALGSPRIYQINSDGIIVEEWKLYGAWIKSVEPGELDYDGEELMAIDAIIKYDFAEQKEVASGIYAPASNL